MNYGNWAVILRRRRWRLLALAARTGTVSEGELRYAKGVKLAVAALVATPALVVPLVLVLAPRPGNGWIGLLLLIPLVLVVTVPLWVEVFRPSHVRRRGD
jgi:hypothetical protein